MHQTTQRYRAGMLPAVLTLDGAQQDLQCHLDAYFGCLPHVLLNLSKRALTYGQIA